MGSFNPIGAITGALGLGGGGGGSSSSSSTTTKVGGNQVSGRSVVGLTGAQPVKLLQQFNKAVATGQKTTGTIILVAGVVAVAFLVMRK